MSKEELDKIYNRYFSEVDDTLHEYLWQHVNNNIEDNFMETLWGTQEFLDRFHGIRNQITQLLVDIEIENENAI